MRTTIPSDLLRDIDGAPPSAQRLYVTLWALAVDDHTPRHDVEHWRAVHARALGAWPKDQLTRRGRLTVVSVLLELEQLGILTGIGALDGGFTFDLREERAA